MASGLYTKRDFQIAETMAWHNLTMIAKPSREAFPNIVPMPLYFNGGQEAIFGSRKFVIPVAEDDMLPVAPPYCGETIPDDEPKTCPAKPEDTRGTYILFTPREAWDWVHDVLSGTQFDVSSIGMLWNRSFWFIGVTLTELKELTVGDGRQSRFQFNFSGGLDRSVSPQCELSSILPVCHNTISLSRATGKILFAERATKNFTSRLEAAKAEVEKAVGMTAVFKAAMDSLADKPCDKSRAERVFAGYLVDEVKVNAEGKDIPMSTRSRNTVTELANLHVDGIANRGETEMDLLNAFTQFYTHGSKEAKTSMGRRFVSSEFGGNADSKADFFRTLTTGRNALPEIEERGARLLAAS